MEPDKQEAEIQRVGLRRQGERHKITCAHGELPRDFIGKFTSRRAFIYMMEIWAAVMAVVFTQEELPPYFFMFVDNQATALFASVTQTEISSIFLVKAYFLKFPFRLIFTFYSLNIFLGGYFVYVIDRAHNTYLVSVATFL